MTTATSRLRSRSREPRTPRAWDRRRTEPILSYKDGAFVANCTMDEMIDFCVQPMVSANPGITEAQARSQMKQFFPTLKRWQGK